MPSDFTYTEPSIASLLIFSTYLYLLNLARSVAQWTLGAGLLGEIAIGIVYGSPLAGWLDADWQGGISTPLPVLRPLLPISAAIAFTGLTTPLALSFLLNPMFGFPILTCFASGAALCSTSLGTTLTVLTGSDIGIDLKRSKLGVALIEAAVADDVVAFVLAEIVHLLGDTTSGGSTLGGAIGRAVGVAFGLGLVAVPLSMYVIRPLLHSHFACRQLERAGSGGYLAICLLTLIGMVAAAGYAGTSPLYGAYIAGLIISYLPTSTVRTTPESLEAVSGQVRRVDQDPEGQAVRRSTSLPTTFPSSSPSHMSSLADPPLPKSPYATAFEHYLQPLTNHILLPIFFGSIGYSIPFLRLWKGSIVWKGIVYALLMLLGKAVCGGWMFWALERQDPLKQHATGMKGTSGRGGMVMRTVDTGEIGETYGRSRMPPALLLGCAMVARGEIGLLIAQIGYHTSTPLLNEEAFLVAIWAIVLNTIVGPVGVSLVLKRYKRRVLGGGWD